MTTSPDVSAALEDGRAALARRDWTAARQAFDRALTLGESPEALEGVGMAAWWAEDYPGAIRAREQAYRILRAAGDRAGAARMAVWLASDYADYRGETAVANGWLRRAERLLDGVSPCPEHAWLAYMKAHFALMVDHDPAEARRLSAEAAALARTAGPADMEMLGIALEGLSLVTEGRIADGMGRLDEASVAVTAGEITDPIMIGVTCCYLIRACEQVRDYDRASQWCERVRDFSRRVNFTGIFAACRIQYAALLTLRGEWEEAETEIEALYRHVETSQPRLIPIARIRLAELRRRQGRLAESASLLAEAGTHTHAILGRAALALDDGAAAEAVDLVEEYLRRVPTEERTGRVPGLEVAVLARTAAGDPPGAAAALDELRDIAARVGTVPLRAAVASAEAAVLSAAGEHAAACARLEDAATLYENCRTPFEGARSRLALARELRASGRPQAATMQARAARTVFEELGADRDALEAGAFLEAGEAKPREHGRGRRPLTAREIEVLRLVAQGLGDREVAARLGLSEHTVHRHITNVLTKTGLPSRTAAVAHAAKQGLL
jgi:ATP/maltotriose-dependent transcriptional regulator MalT